MAGVDRGENIYFAKMSDSKRADMVQVLPQSGVANTWFNKCGVGASNGPGPDN